MRFETSLDRYGGPSHVTIREADTPLDAAVEALKAVHSHCVIHGEPLSGDDGRGHYLRYIGRVNRLVYPVKVYVKGGQQ